MAIVVVRSVGMWCRVVDRLVLVDRSLIPLIYWSVGGCRFDVMLAQSSRFNGGNATVFLDPGVSCENHVSGDDLGTVTCSSLSRQNELIWSKISPNNRQRPLTSFGKAPTLRLFSTKHTEHTWS